jgi:hypothetical protein
MELVDCDWEHSFIALPMPVDDNSIIDSAQLSRSAVTELISSSGRIERHFSFPRGRASWSFVYGGRVGMFGADRYC